MEWLGAFLSYIFVVIFTPGPNNILAMAIANNNGLKNSMKFILGITTGVFMLMNLSAFANVVLYEVLPSVKPYMAATGCIYMTYLGIAFLLPSKKARNDKTELSVIQGLLLQFINPKAILFGITVYASFLIPNLNSGTLLFLSTVFLAGLAMASTFLWALFGSVFQRFLKKFRRPFNIAMAILLFYSAASISGLLDII